MSLRNEPGRSVSDDAPISRGDSRGSSRLISTAKQQVRGGLESWGSRMFRPDLTAEGKKATREDAEPLFTIFQAMPIPYVEPEDIANLGVFLASDESRYITGQQIRVDGGSLLKWPNGPGG